MIEVMLTLSTTIYRLAAIKKAAYRLGNRCAALIELTTDGNVALKLISKRIGDSTQSLEADFLTELLDQELRETIAEETAPIRNLLLAQAFSGLAANE